MNARRAHLTDKALYRRFYDMDGQPDWMTPMEPREARLLWALEHIGPDDNVVDIGCHKGEMTIRLWPHTRGRVVGVDIAEHAIAYGRRTAARAGADITFVCADAEDIPLAGGTFDVAVVCEILEHVPSPEAVLREAERLLRPGGTVVISVPVNAEKIDRNDAIARDKMGLLLDMHVREYDPVTALADRAGLVSKMASMEGGYEFRLAAYEVPAAA